MDADIAFIKLCKKEQFIPTFAKVNISIRNGTYKLKRKSARLVMETELQNKHREKGKLRKNIRTINVLLSTSLSVIVYNALLHQINIAVKSRMKVIKLRHGKKLYNRNLKQETTNYVDERKRSYIKHTVDNFSSYVLSNEEYTALSFGLDHHIPTKSKNVAIEVEIEQFYQSLLRNLMHIPDNELTSLKTKLKSTCGKYSKINVPYKYKKFTDNLFKNKSIVILKQYKGRGVVILDTTKYTEKCMALLNTEHFKRLVTDPTAATEQKIQNVLRRIKSKSSEQEYKRFYTTGSATARFYGTAKIRKLKDDRSVDELPIRPIISNINTASYQLVKYLAKLLSPLSMSEYTVKSTSDFITHIKGQNIPKNFKLISFDVTSLFKNVPLDFTIDVILKRIYDENEVNSNIPKQQRKDLLLLCTKNVQFFGAVTKKVTMEMSIHKQTVWQWVRRWVQYLHVYLWLN